MIAASKGALDSKREIIKRFLQSVTEATSSFITGGQHSLDFIVERHHLKPEDAAKWFGGVKYSPNSTTSRKVLVKTVDTLIKAKILNNLEKSFSFQRFYDIGITKFSDVDVEEIKTMKLFYAQRVLNELKKQHKETGPLQVVDLMHIDQLHYHGHKAVDHAAEVLKFNSKRVLDIGSGLGGPARYMAWKYDCYVQAIEVEVDRNTLAQSLTDRCGLTDKIEHRAGDFNVLPVKGEPFDHFVSWLSILHIKDRIKCFKNCYNYLKPGASFFIEDFVQVAPFTEQERSDLEIVIACPFVPTFKEYVSHLEACGFEEIKYTDISADWTSFAVTRLQKHEENKKEFIAIHGETIYTELGYFFAIIVNLFTAGHLGGILITGRKKKI